MAWELTKGFLIFQNQMIQSPISSNQACQHVYTDIVASTDIFLMAKHFSFLLTVQNITTLASVAYMTENAMVTILVDKTLVFQQERHAIQVT